MFIAQLNIMKAKENRDVHGGAAAVAVTSRQRQIISRDGHLWKGILAFPLNTSDETEGWLEFLL